MRKVGRIERVDLRDIWPHEAHDFTKWMAEGEGLELLSEALGLELEDSQAEASVGSFNVDVLACESGTDRKVVIENQLEDTNHNHLGQLITYAAGTDASYAIWVVKRAREEHQKAIEWLNGHTDMDLGFFLVEIEAVRIGDSLPAPMFTVIEKPNDWAKTTKSAEGLNETQKLRLAYWQRYHDLASSDQEFSKVFKPRKPSPDHWTTLSIGMPRCHISLLMSVRDDYVGLEFYVPDDKDLARRAIDASSQLSEAVGVEAVPFEASKAAGLRFFKKGCDPKAHHEKWDEYITWQLGAAVRLRAALYEVGL